MPTGAKKVLGRFELDIAGRRRDESLRTGLPCNPPTSSPHCPDPRLCLVHLALKEATARVSSILV
jgi:hypothetical protein